jgi:hypothetical protein
MKIRKIILLSALILLAGIYTFQLITGSRNSIRDIVLEDTPDRITIQNGSETVVLVRNGDDWLAGDAAYPADSYKMGSITAGLASVKVLDTVSSNTDDERYGLEDSSAITVTAEKGGKTVRTLRIGKSAVTSVQTYAVVDNSKSVSLVSGSLRDVFGITLDSVRDKTIYSVSSADITGVTVTIAGSESYTLVKSGDPAVWTPVVELDGFNAEAAASWASGLSTLKAKAFIYDEDAAFGGKSLAGTLLLTSAGKEITVTLYRADDDQEYACRSSESVYPFTLSASDAGKFLKPSSALTSG